MTGWRKYQPRGLVGSGRAMTDWWKGNGRWYLGGAARQDEGDGEKERWQRERRDRYVVLKRSKNRRCALAGSGGDGGRWRSGAGVAGADDGMGIIAQLFINSPPVRA